MPEKAVYLLVVEGFADWEPAHAVAELRRQGHYRVESVGLTSAAVRSMGGITVLPSRTVSEVNTSDVAVFILPGIKPQFASNSFLVSRPSCRIPRP
jgi:putative intracellular protease/amidase